MSKAGPIKHCHCCNKPMMNQVIKCNFCGADQNGKRIQLSESEKLRRKALVLGSAAAMFIPS